jgi:hypothetical protein
VVADGELLHYGAFGVRNIKTGEPARLDTQLEYGKSSCTAASFIKVFGVVFSMIFNIRLHLW